MKTIAVIEDDIYIGNVLEEILTESGYSVIRAYSGTEGLLLLEKSKPDLVLLDLMLPGMSGEEVLQNISELAPVMILSAKTEVSGKVKNLNAGAVDYITKPFDNDELLARVGVALRRREAHADGVVSRAGIVMDTDTYSVTVEGKPLKLTKTEFAILKMFLLNPKKSFFQIGDPRLYQRLYARRGGVLGQRPYQQSAQQTQRGERQKLYPHGVGHRLSVRRGTSLNFLKGILSEI